MAGLPELGVAVIGDEDTVSGMLLAGCGQKDSRGSTFVVADAKTSKTELAARFSELAGRDDLAVIVVTQDIADLVRPQITRHSKPLPTVLELPARGQDPSASHDPIMARVSQLVRHSDGGEAGSAGGGAAGS